MTTHTAGPWLAEGAGNGSYLVFSPGYQFIIAEVSVPINNVPITIGEALDNRRLIAAAPELLDCLRACVDKIALWPEGDNPEFLPCMKQARALLARLEKGERL